MKIMNKEFKEKENKQEDISKNIKKLKSFVNDLIPDRERSTIDINDFKERKKKIEILNQHYGLTITEAEELLNKKQESLFVKYFLKDIPIKLLLDTFFSHSRLLGEEFKSTELIEKLLDAFDKKEFNEEQINFCFILAGKKSNLSADEVITYIKEDSFSFELQKKSELQDSVSRSKESTNEINYSELSNIYDNISERKSPEKLLKSSVIKSKKEAVIQNNNTKTEKIDEKEGILKIIESSDIGFTLKKEGNNYKLSIFKDKELIGKGNIPKNVRESQIRFIFISYPKLKKIKNRKEIIENAIPLIRKEIDKIK